MHEIDDMDMLGFLKVRAWDAQREHNSLELKPAYIDQVWPNLQTKSSWSPDGLQTL